MNRFCELLVFFIFWIKVIYVYIFVFCNDNFQVSWIKLECNLLVKFMFNLIRSYQSPSKAFIAVFIYARMMDTHLFHTPTCHWHCPILDFNGFCWQTVGCYCLYSISFKADVTATDAFVPGHILCHLFIFFSPFWNWVLLLLLRVSRFLIIILHIFQYMFYLNADL